MSLAMEFLERFVPKSDSELKPLLAAVIEVCKRCQKTMPHEFPQWSEEILDIFESTVGDLLLYFCTRSLEEVDSSLFWVTKA